MKKQIVFVQAIAKKKKKKNKKAGCLCCCASSASLFLTDGLLLTLPLLQQDFITLQV